MRKKRKKNNFNKIIIASLIILICLIITIYFISAKKTKKEDEQVGLPQRYIESVHDLKDKYINDDLEIVPDGYISWARTYEEIGTGNYGRMYEMLYMVAFRQVKHIYNALDVNSTESDMRNYYEKNKSEIEEDTGITDVQDYVKLAKIILEKQPGEYKNTAFDFSYYEDIEDYTTAGINIEYSNTTLKLKLQVANKEENGKTEIKILAR